MNTRSSKLKAAVLVLLLLALGIFLMRKQTPMGLEPQPITPPPVQVPKPPPQPNPHPQTPLLQKTSPSQLPKKIADIHKELIPKDVTIVRFHYDRDLVVPGERLDFDINGSGFTPTFKRSISIDPTDDGINVTGLKLITLNQIHGTFAVSAKTPTKFIFPRVLIKNQPVFQTSDPFGVVRPREVLQANFVEVGQDGRSAHLRIITNLKEQELNDLQVESNVHGIDFKPMGQALPFVVDQFVHVEDGVPDGSYDLRILWKKETIFEQKHVMNIVKPTFGETGIPWQLEVEDPYSRPSGEVRGFLDGSGFHAQDLEGLSARVKGLEVQNASFTFVNAGRLGFLFSIPQNAAPAPYPIEIRRSGKSAISRKNAFTVVPENWLRRLATDFPAAPGKSGVLKMEGLGLTEEFAKSLTIQADEPGIAFGQIVRLDDKVIAVPIQISSSVAPGDYLINIRSNPSTSLRASPVKILSGNVIHVSAP